MKKIFISLSVFIISSLLLISFSSCEEDDFDSNNNSSCPSGYSSVGKKSSESACQSSVQSNRIYLYMTDKTCCRSNTTIY